MLAFFGENVERVDKNQSLVKGIAKLFRTKVAFESLDHLLCSESNVLLSFATYTSEKNVQRRNFRGNREFEVTFSVLLLSLDIFSEVYASNYSQTLLSEQSRGSKLSNEARMKSFGSVIVPYQPNEDNENRTNFEILKSRPSI